MAHLGVMYRHDAVPAHPLAYARRRQAVRIGSNPNQERLTGRRLIPVDRRGALETGRQVPGISLPRGPGGQLRPLQLGQRAQQLADAVRQQIVGVLPGPAPPDGRRVLAGTLGVRPHLHLHTQGHLPTQVHRGAAVRFRITDPVMRL